MKDLEALPRDLFIRGGSKNEYWIKELICVLSIFAKVKKGSGFYYGDNARNSIWIFLGFKLKKRL